MIVVAGGDSFVWGSELKDSSKTRYSLQTFTAQLASDNKYLCAAWPGFGNDSIARTVIAQCEQLLPERPFVIVSWTFPGRFEFRFNYNTQQRNSPWYTINAWTVVQDVESIEREFMIEDRDILEYQVATINRAKQTGVAEFAKTFYRHVGDNEYWEVYSALKEIVYLQNYLKTNGIGYMFTCADNTFWYNHTIENADSTIHSLVEQIARDQDNWFWFDAATDPWNTQKPRGFYQWAVENKYRMGTTHPLEEAHSAATQLMKDKFNELVKKSIQQN